MYDNIDDIIEYIALKNAITHNGQAHLDSVLSKLIGSNIINKSDIKILIPRIRDKIMKINSISNSEQQNLIEKISIDENLFKTDKVKMQESSLLPPLADTTNGVVTRFPPEPNGYPHIGHAKAAIIDEEYAKMYNGIFILRFDDTNPLKEKLEYYDAIEDGIKWLGVKPNKVKNTSDDIKRIYEYGKKLVYANGAYICTCKQEIIKKNRSIGKECNCRLEIDKYDKRLEQFFGNEFIDNEAIIRFKGDMQSQNTALRDPTLFRIINSEHPKLGNKYNIWPTYDFAAPIEDSLDGVTHAMRTKEYELRNELYYSILEKLNLRKPNLIEFSRLEFEGLPVSKRKLKPLVENNILESWDDPRLPTLLGLKRRGFTPDAIRRFVFSLGITLSDTKPSFEVLESFNRKIIDQFAYRLYFVKNPYKLVITGSNNEENLKKISIKNHPTIDKGVRQVITENQFYISDDDAISLHNKSTVRLMELYNVKIIENNNEKRTLIGEYLDEKIVHDIPKIHWVSINDAVPYKIIVPHKLFINEDYNPDSLEIIKGFAESFTTGLPIDTNIQFVRFGFCRIDSKDTAIFTHR